MSRLEFAPEPREMDVTDIATGHFVFTPVEGEQVSYLPLDEAIRNAGYEIESVSIRITGAVRDRRHVETPAGQRFHLEAADDAVGEELAALEAGAPVTVTGAWRTEGETEVVTVRKIARREP